VKKTTDLPQNVSNTPRQESNKITYIHDKKQAYKLETVALG
jgi:hypothetical protein